VSGRSAGAGPARSRPRGRAWRDWAPVARTWVAQTHAVLLLLGGSSVRCCIPLRARRWWPQHVGELRGRGRPGGDGVSGTAPPVSCARASARDPNDDVDDAAVRRPEPFSLPAARDGQHATVKGSLRGRQPLGGAFGHRRGQLDQVMKAGRPGGRDADPAGTAGRRPSARTPIMSSTRRSSWPALTRLSWTEGGRWEGGSARHVPSAARALVEVVVMARAWARLIGVSASGVLAAFAHAHAASVARAVTCTQSEFVRCGSP